MSSTSWGFRRPNKPDRVEWSETKADNGKYTKNQLEALAYWILRDDAETIDEETGKKKGLKGENYILFDEHIYQRRRREILNKNGVPEPELVSGMYWKCHPEGRKVNSEEARKRGSGYFR